MAKPHKDICAASLSHTAHGQTYRQQQADRDICSSRRAVFARRAGTDLLKNDKYSFTHCILFKTLMAVKTQGPKKQTKKTINGAFTAQFTWGKRSREGKKPSYITCPLLINKKQFERDGLSITAASWPNTSSGMKTNTNKSQTQLFTIIIFIYSSNYPFFMNYFEPINIRAVL